MLTFSLDSAGSRCLIALGRGSDLLGSTTLATREALSETILGATQALLEQHQVRIEQIDRFGVGIGPGGFTSLRVGIATVKGIAYAHSKPLVALDSLALVARSWSKGKTRLVLREAYRGEVYTSAYQVNGNEYVELFAPVHGKPAALAPLLQEYAEKPDAVIGGSGLENYREQWLAGWGNVRATLLEASDEVSAQALVSATHDHYQSRGPSSLLALEPQYVREADAALPKNSLGAQAAS